MTTPAGGRELIRYELSVMELRGLIRFVLGRCHLREFRYALEAHGWSPGSAVELSKLVGRARRDVLRSGR